MDDYRDQLIEWLERHDGQEQSIAVSLLKLSQKQSGSLERFLNDKKILVHRQERKGQLLKSITLWLDQQKSSEDLIIDDLPKKLEKYQQLLAAWLLYDIEDVPDTADNFSKTVGEMVSREDLPCPKDEAEAVEQLWSHLFNNGVIKDRDIYFPLGLAATQTEIDDRFKEITEKVKSLPAIDDICWKHRPPPERVTKVSYTNYPAYWKYKCGNVVDKLNPWADKNPTVEEEEDILKWLNDCKREEHLASYRAEIVSALTNSFGQLKTVPVVTASFQPLSNHFMTDQSEVCYACSNLA